MNTTKSGGNLRPQRSSGPNRASSSSKTAHSKPFSRSSQGSFRRAGGPARGGQGGRNSGGKRGPTRGERIDYRRFVNKAKPITEEVFVPKNTFSTMGLHPEILKSVALRGYINPSAIQDGAIPEALTGRDIVGLADTGTGKTASFLLPILHSLKNNPKQKALIMAPTRELALQIEKELMLFTRTLTTRINHAACVGGAPISRQVTSLRRGAHIIIGTPGRLRDLFDRGDLELGSCTMVVLDEADRMLDMGFMDDMKFLIGRTNPVHQTLFFSATFPETIKKFAYSFLKDPFIVSVKTRDTSQNVDQDVIRVAHPDQKIEKLHDILNQDTVSKTIIFLETKRHVDKITTELRARGFNSASLHGDKHQRERSRVIQQFRDNQVQILVATDVAARGLDIPNVSHVINYDIPQTYDTYVHRIGRTGRGSQKGTALTFVIER